MMNRKGKTVSSIAGGGRSECERERRGEQMFGKEHFCHYNGH